MGRLLAGLAILAVACALSAPARCVDGPFPPFAVVGLFTSEGCSSCPPVERIFTNLLARGAARQQPVYGLAFHVDYVDHVGWKEPAKSTHPNSSSMACTSSSAPSARARGSRWTPRWRVRALVLRIRIERLVWSNV